MILVQVIPQVLQYVRAAMTVPLASTRVVVPPLAVTALREGTERGAPPTTSALVSAQTLPPVQRTADVLPGNGAPTLMCMVAVGVKTALRGGTVRVGRQTTSVPELVPTASGQQPVPPVPPRASARQDGTTTMAPVRRARRENTRYSRPFP